MRKLIFAVAVCWFAANNAQGDPTSFYPEKKCHAKGSWSTCDLLWPGQCCYTDPDLNHATVPSSTTLEVCSTGGPSDCCVIQVNVQYQVQCSGKSTFRVKPGTTCEFKEYVFGSNMCKSMKYKCRDATQAERDAGLCQPLSP